MNDTFVFVGTYAPSDAPSIYTCRWSPAQGSLDIADTTDGVENPSFLTIDKDGQHLYSVCETASLGGTPGGGAAAFRIHRETGSLSLLNMQSSKGPGSCHVTLDRTGRFLVVSNYGGGSVAVLPVQDDGTLAAASSFVQHEGAGPNPDRQEGPHAHSAICDPVKDRLFVSDLGLDKVLIYELDTAAGKVTPNDPPYAETHPGAGPRHFVLDNSGSHAYGINELDSTITVYDYDRDSGRLAPTQTVSTLPENFDGHNQSSDIHLHPSGRFLYGANRGHDSIAVFAVDAKNGRLTATAHESTRGHWPRNFAVDPSGAYLLAANERSGTIHSFAVDRDSGQLEHMGQACAIPKPVCIQFL